MFNFLNILFYKSFNSQPPEGGWFKGWARRWGCMVFQLTAARRRLGVYIHGNRQPWMFQLTAARRRLVESQRFQPWVGYLVSTHSRPKAAGHNLADIFLAHVVSTHSRPKAAGLHLVKKAGRESVSTHSRPKAAGASAETLNRQGLHCPVSLRFH